MSILTNFARSYLSAADVSTTPPVDPPAPGPVSYSTPKICSLLYAASVADLNDANFRANLAQTDLLIFKPTLTADTSYQSAFSSLKAQFPNTKFVAYVCVTEILNNPASSEYAGSWTGGTLYDGGIKPYDKVAAMNWWLRTVSGTIPQSYAGNNDVNYTDRVPTDGSGRDYAQWYGEYMTWLYRDRMGLQLDGWMADNTKRYGYSAANWLLDGVDRDVDSDATVQQETRAGHRKLIDTFRVGYPSGIFIGNGQQNTTAEVTAWHASAELNQAMNGILYEGWDGKSYSDWDFYTFSHSMANLGVMMDACADPKMVVLMVDGTQSDYKKMRRGLAVSLLAGCYFHYADTSSQFPWMYDEYAADLGAPLDPRPSAPLTASLWGRRYENGYVLFNAAQSGGPGAYTDPGTTITYTGLPAGVYKRLNGAQVPLVNDGSVVGAGGIDVPSWDARILLCVNPGVHT